MKAQKKLSDKELKNEEAKVFELPFANAKRPATEKQILYLRSFEEFQTVHSSHQLKKRLSTQVASGILDLLEKGIAVLLK